MASLTYAQAALKAAQDAYTKQNPLSLQAHQAAHNSLPGGNTRTVLHADPFPITWDSGKDATLTSIDGHTYADLLGEFSAGIFGHSDQRIAQAVQDAMKSGWNFGGNSRLEKALAHKVVDRFRPSGIELVRFTNSGTEANTTCLGAAVAITQRRKILVFSGGYHGSTLVFPMALMQGLLKTPSMNLPHEFVFGAYNNIPETKAVIAALPQDSLAAILIEPIQGSGGCRPATQEFMQYLRQVTDETGALLVIDEVMASRLCFSGYSAAIGIRGDFVTLGKYIAGGMTSGAFGGRKDLMELFDPTKNQLFHPGTYNNNVLSMNAGLIGLDIYNAEEVDRLNRLGEDVKAKIQQVLIDEKIYPEQLPSASTNLIEIDSFKDKAEVIDISTGQSLRKLPPMFITGKGSMLNIRFSGPEAATWQALFWHHLLTRDIFIAVRGYTPLNLKVTATDAENYVSAIREFVQQHKAQLLAQEPVALQDIASVLQPKPAVAISMQVAATA
ncbi:hypothetical protein LTR84_003947 [Exophiala bonariae]|uniref:Glutamate-1-semialdehyde 2,1-aminomutase n=1 Tax=Exophiala bonariae TaxID=1690606 RepID=A0AAV9N920_9EURO|nr:hypothetical protein LTR84_003947 [Exophiala bonariae]